MVKTLYHGLVFLLVNFGPLVPTGHQRELFQVGHHAFDGAMGVFVGCRNRKKNVFFPKIEKIYCSTT